MVTLQEYIFDCKDTLQYWLKMHTDAETWAESWSEGGDWSWLLENVPVMRNDYFSFDLRDYVAKYVAEQDLNYYQTCVECGTIQDSGGDECEDCGGELRDTELGELEELYGGDVLSEVPENIIRRIVENEGFEAYTEGIGPVIEPIVEEIESCLEQIDSENPADVLLALTWANHIMHVTGNIFEDYWQGAIDYDDICAIAEDGFAAYFGEEEVKEFLGE